ncbi:MAG: MBOAT family O-acyltransferase [Pseudomonadota bacterium]
MNFISLSFLVFAVVVLPLQALLQRMPALRTAFLLIASYIFYGWWDVRFLLLIFGSTAIDYGCGIAIRGGRRALSDRLWLLLSLTSNLGCLAAFKYFSFFAEGLKALLAPLGIAIDSPALNHILPVGISFYTFQSMSYTIDRYRGDIALERDFVRFAAYVALFPQLVAGPIVRARELLPQLAKNVRAREHDILRGVEIILFGLALKLIVANRLAPLVDERFDFADSFMGGDLLLAGLFFGFQIYGDFAGYSLIAIGLARIMGFRLPQNFNRPYFAASPSDFWRRWHMTLSRWLRDYLYVPLGGNRKGSGRTLINLMLVMLLGGLWHGAAIPFLLWGGYHGVLLIAGRLLQRRQKTRPNSGAVRRWFGTVITFVAVFVGWLIFRAETAEDLLGIAQIIRSSPLHITIDPAMITALGVCALTLAFDGVSGSFRARKFWVSRPTVRFAGLSALTFLIVRFGQFDGGDFIYFQF